MLARFSVMMGRVPFVIKYSPRGRKFPKLLA